MRLSPVLRMCYEYSNYPKRYIERQMYKGSQRETAGLSGIKIRKKKNWYYGATRPWEEDNQNENAPGVRHPKIFLEPIKEWNVFKGDLVEVLVGKDKGKQGIINYVVKQRNWVFVDGLHCEHKFIKSDIGLRPTMVKSELPLSVTTDIALVDPSDNKVTEVEWRYTEEGKRVRVSTRTGRILPLSAMAEETRDYKTKSTYKEQEKDTRSEDLEKVTFEPKLMSFEQDIMDSEGIIDRRMPAKSWWY
ncbi:PREDICTED: probable 39S ribosomal protein L24, mitochondrial [Priapulus caudatus]|uniref:Large ribosomal subunit protein uL24m n=1 Tax=Priapulus caudatus TaxID=37621 RepID=A0ABM1DVJ7_PRICU|nr:PREDICTED: probable 39S ribosomal protein L24, mitochondrial [Priapulus caudatus]XP_014663969.1 PREDICTED: probable 39S ribosomal protein L24, mitochondrial [Priapulus caudatus]